MNLFGLSTSVIAFLFVVSVVLTQDTACAASNSKPGWRTKLSNGAIFFPYAWCLSFKIIDVAPHTDHVAKIDDAAFDVKVKVEYVLRDGTEVNKFEVHKKDMSLRPGDIVTFCLPKDPHVDLRQYFLSRKGKTQTWAFSTSMCSEKRLFFDFKKRFEPFDGQDFSTNDVKALAADLKKVLTDPKDAKPPIERYLRERWPENRIRDFCHRDSRLIRIVPIPNPDDFQCDLFGYRGILYPASKLGKAMWLAYTVKNSPTHYGLILKRGKSIWQLERADFALGSPLSDDDVLKMRIHDVLLSGYMHSFDAHPRGPKTKEEYGMQAIFSSTPLCFVNDWKTYTIERDTSGKVRSVSCITEAGPLKVILNSNKDVQAVQVNGVVDKEWAVSLAAVNKERDKLYGP